MADEQDMELRFSMGADTTLSLHFSARLLDALGVVMHEASLRTDSQLAEFAQSANAFLSEDGALRLGKVGLEAAELLGKLKELSTECAGEIVRGIKARRFLRQEIPAEVILQQRSRMLALHVLGCCLLEAEDIIRGAIREQKEVA